MSSLNSRASRATNTYSGKTHEGAPAKRINAELELRRTVMASMLWENSFYESGESVADRIKTLVPKVPGDVVAAIAIEAREQGNLRHVPLLLVREMARTPEHKKYVADTLERVIQRPDEITELVSIYWKDGKEKLSNQLKKGLGRSFAKFNEYSLAKFNRDGAVKLRDVLFLTHAKPKDASPRKFTKKHRKSKDHRRELSEGEQLYKKVVDNKLEVPDTWEVALSGGANKKDAFERLMAENKLGALATLRNLRGMKEAGVSDTMIRNYVSNMKTDRVLPFRFIAAAKYAPQLEDVLEKAMLKNCAEMEKLPGKTVLLVDVSGSMSGNISDKSEMSRLDAASALAMLLREIGEQVEVYTFSDSVTAVPPRRGFALRDAIGGTQGGTNLGGAIRAMNDKGYDRLIVFTDEQSADPVGAPKGLCFLINVANYKHGVGYGRNVVHIDGFSESIVKFIQAYEKSERE